MFIIVKTWEVDFNVNTFQKMEKPEMNVGYLGHADTLEAAKKKACSMAPHEFAKNGAGQILICQPVVKVTIPVEVELIDAKMETLNERTEK